MAVLDLHKLTQCIRGHSRSLLGCLCRIGVATRLKATPSRLNLKSSHSCFGTALCLLRLSRSHFCGSKSSQSLAFSRTCSSESSQTLRKTYKRCCQITSGFQSGMKPTQWKNLKRKANQAYAAPLPAVPWRSWQSFSPKNGCQNFRCYPFFLPKFQPAEAQSGEWRN